MHDKMLMSIECALNYIHKNPYFIADKNRFMQLVHLLKKCKSGFARSLSTRYEDLLAWINHSLPQLQDECYQASTKCYWILNGLTDFPKCKHCEKPLIGKNAKLTTGYKTYCSVSCEVKDTKVLKNALRRRWQIFRQSTVSFKKRPCDNNDYKKLICQMLSYMPEIDQIRWIVDNRNDSCIKILTSKRFEHLLKFVHDQTKFLDAYDPQLSVRIFCVYRSISSINDNNLRCKTCKRLLLDKQCSFKHGFQEHCSMKCMAQNKDIALHKVNTCCMKYGTPAWNTRIVDVNALTIEQKANRKDVWDRHAYIMEKNHGIKNYGCSENALNRQCSIFAFNIYNVDVHKQLRYSSKAENRCFHMLLLLYPHLQRQFKSIEYPFNCDFYDSKSKTYIEFNGTWEHGGHFYNEFDANDYQTAMKWKTSSHASYKNAFNIWTIRDLQKRRCAEENGLKYIVFWSEKEVRDYVLEKLQKISSKM